jgi:hypothetical protein
MLPENLPIHQHPAARTSPARGSSRRSPTASTRWVIEPKPGPPTEHDGWSAGDPTVRSGLETGADQRISLKTLPGINPPADLMDQIADLIIYAQQPAERASVIAAL